MSSLIKAINSLSQAPVEIGTVVGKTSANRYSVNVAGRIINMESMYSAYIAVGAVALINKDKNKRYIVGVTPTTRATEQRTVVIDV